MNILKELAVALQPAADPTGLNACPSWFEPKTFRWSLDLDQNGQPTHPSLIDLADPNDPNTKKGISHDAPHMVRARKIVAFPGADNLKYVLGWCTQSPPEKLAWALDCLGAFKAAVAGWSAADPADRVAVAVHAFYKNGHHLAVSHPAGKWTDGDNVLLTVGGEPVTRNPVLQAEWAKTVTAQKAAGIAMCLVCGETGTTLATLPQLVHRRNLPGADHDVAVISVNESLFGHTEEKQLGSSPICESCGEAIVKNLNTITALSYGSGARTNATSGAFHVSGMKTKFIWWLSPTATLTLDPDDPPTPDSVAELLNRIESKPSGVISGDTNMFYGLTLAANTARLVISDTMSEPIADVERHLAAWFTDMRLSPQRTGEAEMFPLWCLVRSFGIYDGTTYSTPKPNDIKKAHDPHRPLRTHQHLLHASLTGGTIPSMYLRHLIGRITADHGLRDDRIAALKLCLARYPNRNQETTMPTPGLDRSNTNPAYLCGQILALFEEIQQVAHDPRYERRVNATFISKYLSGAIATPRRAIVTGRQQAEAWLKKARRDSPSRGARLSKDLDILFNQVSAAAGLPERLPIADQALVILGYHHYKVDSKHKSDDRKLKWNAKMASNGEGELFAVAPVDAGLSHDLATAG